MITLDLSILNQKGTPMFYSDIFANRPAAGVVGRIFISTDTYEFYRDTGSAWDAIGGSASGITGSGTAGTLPIWTGSSVLGDSTLLEGATKFTTTKDFQADGYYLSGMTGGTGALYYNSLPEDRVTVANYNAGGTVYIEVNGGQYATIFGADKSLTNNGYISAVPTLTAANNASSLASYGINTLSYAAGFSSNNIGALYGGIAGFNLQTFAGSATFAQANVASGGASVNSIDFSSAGSTITMTQAAGIRVMSGQQNLFQYQGTNSGTITHAAISQNTGFYRPTAASGILTITNAYSLLLNALDDYGAGFSFTNRWGIYQAGASDKNYFAANMLLGSTTDNGNRLQVTGNGYLSGSLGINNISPNAKIDIGIAGGLAFRAYYGSGNNRTLDINIDGANGDAQLTFNTTYNSGWKYYLSNYAAKISSGDGLIFSVAPSGTAGNPITFIQAMTLNSSGNLLVGNTVNRLRLTVSGDNSNAPTLGVASGTTIFANAASITEYGMNFGVSTTGYGWIQQHRFDGSATSYALALQPSGGNVLLGLTTDSGKKLQVNGTADFIVGSSDAINLKFSSGYGNTAFGVQYDSVSDGGNFLTFKINNAAGNAIERVKIFGNGNMSVGSSNDTGNKLYLNGSLRIDGQQSATAGGSSGQHLIINLDGTTYKIALLNP